MTKCKNKVKLTIPAKPGSPFLPTVSWRLGWDSGSMHLAILRMEGPLQKVVRLKITLEKGMGTASLLKWLTLNIRKCWMSSGFKLLQMMSWKAMEYLYRQRCQKNFHRSCLRIALHLNIKKIAKTRGHSHLQKTSSKDAIMICSRDQNIQRMKELAGTLVIILHKSLMTSTKEVKGNQRRSRLRRGNHSRPRTKAQQLWFHFACCRILSGNSNSNSTKNNNKHSSGTLMYLTLFYAFD